MGLFHDAALSFRYCWRSKRVSRIIECIGRAEVLTLQRRLASVARCSIPKVLRNRHHDHPFARTARLLSVFSLGISLCMPFAECTLEQIGDLRNAFHVFHPFLNWLPDLFD